MSAADLEPTPRTWLLLGPKPGDNGQVLALADALGWPCEIKRFAYRPWELLTNRLLGRTLAGIDRARSSPLAPPWPELVITAGRRNEPVARWLQRQAGGRERLKLVHVGRPWAPLEAFDLIVTTPQYALPAGPNVLHNAAPMHRVNAAALAAASERWAPKLATLPRPWTAVLLGGHVGPFTFDASGGARLAVEVSAMVAADGGSILASTSARTPPAVAAAFAHGLPGQHFLHHWRPDNPDNPYLALLALADRIVVTSDSMSMLIEAIATAKPVFIFDLAKVRDRGLPSRRALLFWLGRWLGPARLVRDVGAIHRAQVAAGRAAWLGQAWPRAGSAPALDDASRAAARTKILLAQAEFVTKHTDR